MLDPFGYQQNVNIFAIKVKCLDPKTYADRERKTLSFFINKLAKFLQDFLFATAFKGAYIKKKKKKKEKKNNATIFHLLNLSPTAQLFRGFHYRRILYVQIKIYPGRAKSIHL